MAWPPNRARDAGSIGSSRACEHGLPPGEDPRRSRALGSSCSTYFFARSRYSHCTWTAVSRRPSAIRSWVAHPRSHEPREGGHGIREREVGEILVPISLSTSAVVPTFKKVANLAQVRISHDHVQASYFAGSAWGSSRVLMIGRFRVVSSPTPPRKKSARWLSW